MAPARRISLLFALALALGLAACGGGVDSGSADEPSPAPAAPAPAESQPTTEGAAPDQFTELEGIPQEGNALGDPAAPVTLIEFADLQCPFCAEWADKALPAVIDEYVRTGEVRLLFNGMAFIGPDSEKALRAVAAASQQGKLWQMVELLYMNQGGENDGWVTDDLLRRLGILVPGLDVERMLADMDSGAVTDLIAGWRGTAAQAGINTTPSFMAGPTDGAAVRVPIDSLEPSGITPALDALLGG